MANIHLMVDEKEPLNTIEATFVCGDFNGIQPAIILGARAIIA